jgi:hypothetical protein
MIGTLTAFQWLIYDSFKVYLGVSLSLSVYSCHRQFFLAIFSCFCLFDSRSLFTNNIIASYHRRPLIDIHHLITVQTDKTLLQKEFYKLDNAKT